MEAGRFTETFVNAGTYLSDYKASHPRRWSSFHTTIPVHLSHTGDADIANSWHWLLLLADKMPKQ